MKTLPHKLNTVKCKLCLPYFEAETKAENASVKLMNIFTTLIEEKITVYVENPGSRIHTYTADYSVKEQKGIILVYIRLSARILMSTGCIKLCKKEILCRWKDTRLISVKTV